MGQKRARQSCAGRALNDVVPQVIPDTASVPDRPPQQVLHPARRGVTGVLGDRPADLQQLKDALTVRSVLVATSTAFELLSNVPQPSQIVCRSSPQTASQCQRWLALARRSPQSTVIAITAPSLPGEQDIQSMLNALGNEE
jgi:hypothetical protein